MLGAFWRLGFAVVRGVGDVVSRLEIWVGGSDRVRVVWFRWGGYFGRFRGRGRKILLRRGLLLFEMNVPIFLAASKPKLSKS